MTAFQTFTAGQVLTAAQVTALQANSTKIAIFQDQKTSGTSGGNATTGSFVKRTLNTTVVNNIAACSISSDVVTLTAGSYLITAGSIFYRVNSYQIRLQNTTAGTTLVTGLSNYADTDDTDGDSQLAFLTGYITLTGSTSLELQYRAAANLNTNSLGVATGFGTEVYSTLTIQQVA